ncbi:MAG: MgtC/SapB family protein [Firmicutes bacterium]|nr:MgtC/SapB family protein [Bacillota bacterium]
MLFQLELILRMFLAASCGVMVGYERRRHHKQAGIGTFMIVCLGACMMMIISKYGFDDSGKFDASRIASQVVSGISFLGAGIIMKRNQNVAGLTTAAAIWAMAGVGMALGAGMYIVGISGLFLYLIFSGITRKIKKRDQVVIENYKIVVTSKEWIAHVGETIRVYNYSSRKHDGKYYLELTARFNTLEEKIAWEKDVLSQEFVIAFNAEE